MFSADREFGSAVADGVSDEVLRSLGEDLEGEGARPVDRSDSRGGDP
jgi:hypothetical protein